MAISSTLKQSAQTQSRQPPRAPPRKSPKPTGNMAGELIVMAALIGLSRAFSSGKGGMVRQAIQGVQTDSGQGDRGRNAGKPVEIPAKGWMDVAWRSMTASRMIG